MKLIPQSTAVWAAMASALVMNALPAVAQTSGEQSIHNERPAEFRDPVTAYLNSKRVEFKQNESRLNASGGGANVVPLYNILKENRAFDRASVVGDSDEQKQQVREALTLSTAQYLASVGFTPNRVARLRNAGVDVVGVAVRTSVGDASFADLVTVAETALLGVAEGRTPAEGGGTFLTITPLSSAGGTPASPLRVLLTSGGFVPEEGSECVFFLSESLHRFRSAGRPIARTAGPFEQQFQPYCKAGDTYTSTSAYSGDRVSIEDARRIISAASVSKP